jgi:hypothetical protein
MTSNTSSKKDFGNEKTHPDEETVKYKGDLGSQQHFMPLSRPAQSENPPRILIIGAGSRGYGYARAIVQSSNGVVVAVAEPDDYKRNALGSKFIWGVEKPKDGQAFVGWKEFLNYEQKRREKTATEGQILSSVDGIFVW